MTSILGLIVIVLVIALVCYIAFWLLNQLDLPQLVRVAIVVIIATMLLIYISQSLGVIPL